MRLREFLIETDPEKEKGLTDTQQNKIKSSLNQETRGYTVNPQVKQLQRMLQLLGYDIGPPGVDGKYGPLTARAVAKFKQDNNISGDGASVGSETLSVMQSAVKRSKSSKPKRGTDPGSSETPGQENTSRSNINSGDIGEAKQVAERFHGSPISDSDWDMLVRATIAEASPNAEERAGIMAVILNRVRSGRYPNSIPGVLRQRNQFQAVTGTAANGRRPSPHYTRTPAPNTLRQMANAIINHLPSANTSWLNFTSAVAAAYGAGTNIGFMRKVANSPGSRKIGKTWFGTV